MAERDLEDSPSKRRRALFLYVGGAVAAIAVAVILSIMLAGDDDGGGPQVAATAPASASAPGAAIDVTATDFKFDKPSVEAPAGGPVTINLKNAGSAPHSIQFRTAKGGPELAPGATGPTIQGGESSKMTFTPPGAGSYYFECIVHPGAMNGTFTVAAAGGSTATAPAVAAAFRLDVAATDFKFDKASLEVPAGGPVAVNLINAGGAPHSIQFKVAKGGAELAPGATGPTIQGGASATVTFTPPGPGTYYFECVVHPGAMNGTLTVAGAAAATATAPAAAAAALDVNATDFKFDKALLEVPASRPVTVNFKNSGSAPHSIQFRVAKGGGELAAGATGPTIQGGGTATLTFTPPGPGSYYFECVVHPGAMNGTLTVSGAAATATAPAATAPPATAAAVPTRVPTSAPTTAPSAAVTQPPPPTATQPPPTAVPPTATRTATATPDPYATATATP
jgi:plastocyanin